MWPIIRTHLHGIATRRYRRRAEHALALNRRGEARNDGLVLKAIRNRLEIQWRARDIHPWDRNLPPERIAPIFVEQALADTEAAVSRLFLALPQIDLIDLTVLGLESDAVIIAGTVDRSILGKGPLAPSVRMRLRQLGLNYHLAGSHFEPLDDDYVQEALRATGVL